LHIIKQYLFFRILEKIKKRLEKREAVILLIYIIEEKRRIFDLVKSLLKNSGKYIFLHDNAEFSEDIKKYINYNEVLIFKAVSPENKNTINTETKVDLAVFGDLKNNINSVNLGKVKTFLLNIENIDKCKNIDFGISQIISCGLREKDTVIFSSIDADESSVMLELQRSIINIKEETVEPFEKKIMFECAINSGETEEMLLALSVLLYCGRLN
jgi:hypothetical protein